MIFNSRPARRKNTLTPARTQVRTKAPTVRSYKDKRHPYELHGLNTNTLVPISRHAHRKIKRTISILCVTLHS